ncbi:hypothetical protein YPPY91_4246, partial [Yersinia pestis PY-91]
QLHWVTPFVFGATALLAALTHPNQLIGTCSFTVLFWVDPLQKRKNRSE